MIDVPKTEDTTLIRIANNRFKQSDTLWSTMEKDYKKAMRAWKNLPDWLSKVPAKRSKARDNRIFLSLETIINTVSGRPVKPNTLPANETEESKELSGDLNDFFMEKWRRLSVKEQVRVGLRHLFFAKLLVIKVFWDPDTDDFGMIAMDPRKVRFSKKASKEEESEFCIEEIEENVLTTMEKFPEKEDKILKVAGITKEQAMEENPEIKYMEVWIGNGVFWRMKGEILDKKLNPYWDWEGLILTPEERQSLNRIRSNGRRRRDPMSKFKKASSSNRANLDEIEDEEKRAEEADKFEAYLYNHFDKPRKPYIFGTILRVENKPTGDSSYIEQVQPLQDNVDLRKRQISDNAEFVNGIVKVDTRVVNMSHEDAHKLQWEPSGTVIGPGVMNGVKRETGNALPEMVFKDMQDSRVEIDNLLGTTNTFRGERGQGETATGRAILREQSFIRLDELISLVDFVGKELYNWWFQLMKVNYTESHYLKILGNEKAQRVVEIMQDDLEDGIEIQVIPGQTIPEDEVIKSERISEDFAKGLIDPLTYFENIGNYHNPEEAAKRLIKYQTNPFSVVKLDEDDIRDIVEANEVLSGINPQKQEAAKRVASQRERIARTVQSPEFRGLPPEEQKAMLQQIKRDIQNTGRAPLPEAKTQ